MAAPTWEPAPLHPARRRRLVGQIMNRAVVKAAYDTPFEEIAALLARHGISGLPVIDDDENVLGVVSRSDLMISQIGKEAEAEIRPRRRARMLPARPVRTEQPDAVGDRYDTAGELMTSPAVTVGPHRTVAEAARVMAEHGVKRLPVIDEEGRLTGIVTRSDLLSVFLRPDAEIRDEVIEDVLVRILWLAPQSIAVEVRAGVVTLTGTLQRRSDVPVAVRNTSRVDGVVDVVDRLGYREDDSHLEPSERALYGVTGEWLRKL